jgi:hypothetical protein
MQCGEARENVPAYLDGELDAVSSRELIDHLRGCVSCRKVLHDLQEVDSLLRGLPRIDMEPDFAGRLAEKVRQEAGITQEPSRHQSPWAEILRLFGVLLDRIEGNTRPNTRTLDEFGDFPPLSIGSAYFRILGQPGRG